MGNRHEQDAKSSLAIAGEADGELDDRDTLPAPEPTTSRERQDPTPRVNYTNRSAAPAHRGGAANQSTAPAHRGGAADEEYARADELVSEPDLIDQRMAAIAAEAASGADTVRPPAAGQPSSSGTAPALRGGASSNGTAPALRGGASSSGSGTAPALHGGVSSLAPRERAVAAPAQPQQPGSSAALLRVAAIFALCAGAFWVRAQWVERSHHAAAVASGDAQTSAAPPAAVAAPAAAIETPVAPQVAAPAVPETASATVPDEAKSVPAATNAAAPAPLGTPRPALKHARRGAVDLSRLPDEPSRQDVIEGLNQLRVELGECSKGRSGTAEIDLTINSSGAVSYALIGGDFAGTPQGSCIARTIRAARFEPFKKPRVRVLYRMAL